MRTAICIAMLLLAVPALGADATPAAPPSPLPVTYDVWGFRWDGRQYVKQPANCFSTTDLEQAADYAAQLTSYAGWSATTNLPAACVVHTTFHGPAITGARPSAFPAKPTYAVWAYKLTDEKWVKDEQYCWTTTDPLQGWEYAKKFNAVGGWTATDNCPPPVPQAQRYVDGGTVHGAENYKNVRFQICDAAYGPSRPIAARQRFNFPLPCGRWLDLNALVDRAIANGNYSYGGGSSSMDYWPTPSYDNSTSIQDSINAQNMINTQNMLNTQDMINTQNMVNNLQDMVNTQNAVDLQNQINAMQANP